MKKTTLTAALMAAALLSTQAAHAECKRGPELTAYHQRCVATENCRFDPSAACPNALREQQAYAQCAAEVNTTFLACLENCLNRANVEFGCPLQKLK